MVLDALAYISATATQLLTALIPSAISNLLIRAHDSINR